jgi:hypothetical protein
MEATKDPMEARLDHLEGRLVAQVTKPLMAYLVCSAQPLSRY